MKRLSYYLLGFAAAYLLVYLPRLVIEYPSLYLHWLFGAIDDAEFWRDAYRLPRELFREHLRFVRNPFFWTVWLSAGAATGVLHALTEAMSLRERRLTRAIFYGVLMGAIYMADVLRHGLPYGNFVYDFIILPVMIAVQFFGGVVLSAVLPRVVRFLNETRMEDLLGRLRLFGAFARRQ